MRRRLSPRLLFVLLIPVLLAVAWIAFLWTQRHLQLYFLSRGLGT